MDVVTIKKGLENQIGDINKELENIYLPHDAVLTLLGKRTAFEIAIKLVDSLQKEQPEAPVDGEVHHVLNCHYLTTDDVQLSARLREFPEGAKVDIFIIAKKDKK